MSREELAVAKETLEQANRLSAQAQELIDTYAEGVMAGLRLQVTRDIIPDGQEEHDGLSFE